ncbi:MAG: DNA primase, partial [Pyrinomonadaceae bacterium]|nr:DNA primase [Pyrinomonadaceae bacterium]
MRYEKEFLDDLKQRADIVRIIGDYVALKKKGNSFWGNCPFHGEKTPSFSVSPKGFYNCFGCGKKGSVFNFVMEIANAPFGEAVRIVADKSGVSLPEPKLLTKADEEKYQAQQKAREIKKKDSEIVVQLNIYALEFWENFLNEPLAKTAREYLEKRELSLETIKTFR